MQAGEPLPHVKNAAYIALASPANIKTLLDEKNAEIERLNDEIAGAEDWLPDPCPGYETLGERVKLLKDQLEYGIEFSNAEREEWKRIAGRYREKHNTCVIWQPGQCDNRCPICKSYDALTGKGEP